MAPPKKENYGYSFKKYLNIGGKFIYRNINI